MPTIEYHLSEKALDEEFVRTGKRGFARRRLYIDPETLTPEQRAMLVPFGNFFSLVSYRFVPVGKGFLSAASAAAGLQAVPSRARVEQRYVQLDAEPTIEQALEHLARMQAEKAAAEAQVEASRPEYERMMAEYVAEKARREAEQEASRQREAERREAERIARAVIAWGEDGTAVTNLYEALFAAADLERDPRFKAWARRITAVDRAQPNGYCFVGEWVPDQTIEVKREYGVYLLAAATGSRRRQTTNYVVVVMDESGGLHRTDIATDDTDRGWALRIRDDVEALL